MSNSPRIDINKLVWGEESNIYPKVGLFFGTFNPIHIGHQIIANYTLQTTDLDEIWFVVTPHNPHKKKSGLLEDYHRLAIVKEALIDTPRLKASDIEFGMPQPNYTVNTLAVLKEKYPKKQFALIMGEDNLRSLHKWKNYEVILDNHPIVIYPRLRTIQEELSEDLVENHLSERAKITFSDAPVMNISASFIRKCIKEGIDVKYMLSPTVYEYVDRMNFYK